MAQRFVIRLFVSWRMRAPLREFRVALIISTTANLVVLLVLAWAIRGISYCGCSSARIVTTVNVLAMVVFSRR